MVLEIDAIVERGKCIDEVQKALESQDFESAANYVKTFLEIDAKYKDSGSEQREKLFSCKNQLEGIVRSRLSDAVDQWDHVAVLRFIRLYSPLALEEEGLQAYVSYLKTVISGRFEVEFEQLVEFMEHDQSQVNFFACLTNLFKDIVSAIEENEEILRSLCGDGIVYAIYELLEQCNSIASLILNKHMEFRKLSKLKSEINSYKKNMLYEEGPDPREMRGSLILKKYIEYRTFWKLFSKIQSYKKVMLSRGVEEGINYLGVDSFLEEFSSCPQLEKDETFRSLCEENLEEEGDSLGSLILKEYTVLYKLETLMSEISSYKKYMLSGGEEEERLDPREIELFLKEILSLTRLCENYTGYMVSKIEGLSDVDPELTLLATETFRSGNFSQVIQDITSYYVILEGFFMIENVRKAIVIDEHEMDRLTTSMVDDVFYVLQSSCHRSISSSNINSVIAALSTAVSLLGVEYYIALQPKMRGTEVNIVTALNNMDVSSEYALKLRHEMEERCAEVFLVFPTPAYRERIKWCLSELGEMSNRFKKALVAGLEQLASTVAHRIRPVLDTVETVSYELSEAEYAENEVNDPWVQRLLHAVETNTGWVQPLMTANNYDTFIFLVIDFIVKMLENIMKQNRFTELGGLQLDRDVRALRSHFSGMTQRTVRYKFAWLTQMTKVLTLEQVSEILDFWAENAGPMTWRLTPAEVRLVLGRRVDFNPEAIAALQL